MSGRWSDKINRSHAQAAAQARANFAQYPPQQYNTNNQNYPQQQPQNQNYYRYDQQQPRQGNLGQQRGYGRQQNQGYITSRGGMAQQQQQQQQRVVPQQQNRGGQNVTPQGAQNTSQVRQNVAAPVQQQQQQQQQSNQVVQPSAQQVVSNVQQTSTQQQQQQTQAQQAQQQTVVPQASILTVTPNQVTSTTNAGNQSKPPSQQAVVSSQAQSNAGTQTVSNTAAVNTNVVVNNNNNNDNVANPSQGAQTVNTVNNNNNNNVNSAQPTQSIQTTIVDSGGAGQVQEQQQQNVQQQQQQQQSSQGTNAVSDTNINPTSAGQQQNQGQQQNEQSQQQQQQQQTPQVQVQVQQQQQQVGGQNVEQQGQQVQRAPQQKKRPVAPISSNQIRAFGTKYEVKCDETFAYYDGYVVDYDPQQRKFEILYDEDWKPRQWAPIDYIRKCAPEAQLNWRPSKGERVECKAKAEAIEPFGWWTCFIRDTQDGVYVINYEGWEHHHDVMELSVLRPLNPHNGFIFSSHKPIKKEELSIEDDLYEIDRRDGFNWVNENIDQLRLIQERTGLIHLGFRLDRKKLIFIGTQQQINNAKKLYGYLLNIQSRYSSNERSERKKEKELNDDYQKFKECHRIEFGFDPELTRWLIGKGGSNIDKAKDIPGVEHINVDPDRCTCLILARTYDSANQARNILEIEKTTVEIPTDSLRGIIGTKGENVQKLEKKSDVLLISTLSHYQTKIMRMQHPVPDDQYRPDVVTMVIIGSKDAVEYARELILYDVEHFNDMRDLHRRQIEANRSLDEMNYSFGKSQRRQRRQNYNQQGGPPPGQNNNNNNNNNNNYNQQGYTTYETSGGQQQQQQQQQQYDNNAVTTQQQNDGYDEQYDENYNEGEEEEYYDQNGNINGGGGDGNQEQGAPQKQPKRQKYRKVANKPKQ